MNYCKDTEQYINTITKQMESIGVIEDADKENLKLLKIQIELYYRAVEDIESNGLTYVDKYNKKHTNPSFSVQRSAMQNITALLRELSISARQRRFLTKDNIAQETDAMDEFLERIREES